MHADRQVPRWVGPVALAGLAGLAWYITAWAVAGLLIPGFDPARQAISETFAIGAPGPPRALMVSGLAVSGVSLIGFAAALQQGLPGRGAAGPVAAACSGVMTVAIIAFPCTAGCPGTGTTFLDTAHSIVAATGYAALVAAPLLVAARVRRHLPRFAAWSVVIGALAGAGFLADALGFAEAYTGLQQRVYNTLADAWYALAAAVLWRRSRAAAASTGRGTDRVDGASRPD